MEEFTIGVGEGPAEYDDISAMADSVPEDPDASVGSYGKPCADVGGCVTMNIPLFIRVLEMMREELPEQGGDELLHRVVESIVELCGQHGMLTMEQYDEIEAIKDANVEPEAPGMPGEMDDVAAGMGDEETECDYANDDAEPEPGEVDADEVAEEAEEDGDDFDDISDDDVPNGDDKEDEEGEEESDEDEDDDDEGEDNTPPFEGIRRVNDPIMESVARQSYLGRACVTVRDENWEDAREALLDGWNRGYKTLVIDNAVILAEELALPNYKDSEIAISRPFSKEEMLDEAFGRWFSKIDPLTVTFEEYEEIVGADDEVLGEEELTAKKRNALADDSFVYPEERKYPIHDISHARNALSRVSQYGTEAEKKKVRSAVYAKYPSLRDNE